MGGDGRQTQNVIDPNSSGVQNLANRSQLSSNPQIAELLANYGSGQMSLQDALSQAKGAIGNQGAKAKSDLEAERQQKLSQLGNLPFGGSGIKDQINQEYDQKEKDLGDNGTNGLMDQFQNLITTNPMAAQRYGTDELQNNSLTSGLFGQNGMQHQAENDATGQLGQQKSLEDEMNSGDWQKINEKDNTIYGQMSGDLARQTGQQEQQLSQALADRGLGAANSGAAVQGISGIYGNKMEQLSQMQQNLVQQKYNNALNAFQTRNNVIQGALNSDRQTATNLGALGQTSLSNLFNRNMAGRNQTTSDIANANNQKLQNQEAYQGQLNNGFQQEEQTRGPTAGEVAMGLGGSALSGFTGGLGTGFGKGLAGSMFTPKS